MSLTAIVLLVISACMHAGWNFVGKRQYPTTGFFLVANWVGIACISPVLLYSWEKLVFVPQSVWILSVVGGSFYSLYCAALAAAYRAGDLSIAYPLSVSSPVIFVTATTLALGKGQDIVGWTLIGIVTVALGCFILPMKRFGEFRIRNYLNACCVFGCLSGVGIAGMTMADYEALRRLRDLPGKPFGAIEAPLAYILFSAISACLWLGALVVFSPGERKSVLSVFRFSKLSAFLTGTGLFFAYVPVLMAMAHVTNVSFVAAFRQLSIPLGATLAIVFLKEPPYLPKLVGIVIVYGGLVLVGMG
jgi:uncharacterized membrane protein